MKGAFEKTFEMRHVTLESSLKKVFFWSLSKDNFPV